MEKIRIVAVAGPTASGKTDAAIALCRALDGEAVSMDSMQIYCGMDIGTAKPSLRERGGIPHHMLDAVSPETRYSVAAYCEEALPVVEAIAARGKLPVLVGGTGLYLQAMLQPMRFASFQEDSALREAMRREGETPEGKAALHARLAAVDPETAARLPVGDVRRVIRALEVATATGEPLSARADAPERRFDALVLGLQVPRDVLCARIAARVEKMFAAGLEREVRGLLAAGVPTDAQSMQAIGYKEMIRYVRGECTRAEAAEAIVIGTRQYAKRQMTWFRKTPDIEWFDTTLYDDATALHAALVARARKWMRAADERI